MELKQSALDILEKKGRIKLDIINSMVQAGFDWTSLT